MINESKYRGTKVYAQAKRLLIATASSRTPIDYAQIFKILGLPPGNHAAKEAGQLLGEISEDAHNAGLPFLSAVVVRQDTKRPGEGFFVLAEMLGRITVGLSESQRKAFWDGEIQKVYTADWSNF